MATTIGNLVLKISAGVGGLKAGLDQGISAVGKFAKFTNGILASSLSGVGGALNKLASGGDPFAMLYESAKNLIGAIPYVGGFFSAGIGFAEGFWGKLKSVIEEISDMRKQAQKLGTDVGTMGEILFIAGGDAESVVKSLEKFNHKLGDAASGSKSAAKEFRLMGLDSDKLANMNLLDSLKTVADRFKQIANPAQRAHFLFTIFGKAGADMAPLLAKGSKGIEAMAQKARDLGLILTEADATAAAAAKKGMKEFDGIVKGIWTQIALEAIPFIRMLQEELKGSGVTAKAVADIIFGGAKYIIRAAVEVYNIWLKIEAVFGFVKLAALALAKAFVTLGRYIAEATDALTPGGNAKVKESIKELKNWEDAIESVIQGTMKEIKKNIDGVDVDAVMKKLEEFRDRVKEMFTGTGGLNLVGSILGGIDQRAFDAIEKAMAKLDGLKTPFQKWTEEVEELQVAFNRGWIEAELFDNLVGKMTKQLLDQNKIAERKAPEALLRGSQAAFSAINALERGAETKDNDPLKQLAALGEKQLIEEKAMAKDMKGVLGELKKRPVQKIVGLAQ
jgi:hypothetical protein